MRGSIQKRNKGSWRLVFDLERDQTGKRRQKVVTYRGTKREAEKELARILAEAENGGFVEPQKLTLGEFLEKWLADDAANRTAAKTLERYAEICRKHLTPALGNRPLAKLSPMEIQRHYAEALRTGRRDGKGGLSGRTVLHHHRVLRQALQQAVRWRLLTRNPADAVTPPRAERKEMRALDEAEMAALLDYLEGSALYIPVFLAVSTGLRRGELLALRWSDIDLERGTLAVVRSVEETKDTLRLKAPKTKRGCRVVTLPSMAVDVLRVHKVEQAQQRLRLGLGRDEGAFVCGRYDGQLRSPRAFSKEFTRAVTKSGLPRITFHGLRHSHATSLLRAGVHPKVAQERLGHSTIATTLDLYSHVTETMQQDAAQRLDTALRAAIGERTKHEE